MFAFLFGKKEKQVAGAIINSTSDLQAREDLLVFPERKAQEISYLESTLSRYEKKIKQLEKIKESHHQNAIQQKALGKTNSAVHFLKKEKLIEEELTTANGMLLTIIQQRSALEQAYMNKESLQVLSVANKSIKESQSIWSADKVADLMDEIEESKSVAREINDLIASANRSYMSDEELLASLETETKENELVNQIASVPEMPKMPVAPTNIIQPKQVDMIRELEAI